MNQSVTFEMAVPLADSLAVQTIEAFCHEGHVDGPEFWFDVSLLDVVDSLWQKQIEEDVCKSVMYLAFRGHLEQHPTEFSRVRFKNHPLALLKINSEGNWIGIDLAGSHSVSVTPQQVEAEFNRRNDELKARGHGIDVPNDLVDFSIGAHWGIAEFCRLNDIATAPRYPAISVTSAGSGYQHAAQAPDTEVYDGDRP